MGASIRCCALGTLILGVRYIISLPVDISGHVTSSLEEEGVKSRYTCVEMLVDKPERGVVEWKRVFCLHLGGQSESGLLGKLFKGKILEEILAVSASTLSVVGAPWLTDNVLLWLALQGMLRVGR